MVIASFCFASGAILQHMAISAGQLAGQKTAMSLRQITELLGKPRWILGLCLVIVGAGLHLTALSQAPVTVVQPVGVLAVPWSVLLASKIYGYRISAQIWLAVAVTIIGIVGFTFLATRYSDDAQARVDYPKVIIAVLICVVIAAVLMAFGSRISETFRSFALAAAAAVLYGLASALLKSLFLLMKHGAPLVSAPVMLLVLVALGTFLVGGWMIQQAYAVGHAEVVVGALTTIDPLVAVAYGLFVLGEGVGITVGVGLAMICFGMIATGGVAGLSRYHPQARQRDDGADSVIGQA